MDSKLQARFSQTTFDAAVIAGDLLKMQEHYYLPGRFDIMSAVCKAISNNQIEALRFLRSPKIALFALQFAVMANNNLAISEIYQWRHYTVDQQLELLQTAHMREDTTALLYKLIGNDIKQSVDHNILLIAALHNGWAEIFKALWPYRQFDTGFTLLGLAQKMKREDYKKWMFKFFDVEQCHSGLRVAMQKYQLGAYCATSSRA